MDYDLEPISRDQAQHWLSIPGPQRPLAGQVKMADDMNGGRWFHELAPPIFIDKATGAVLNGFTRLSAYLLTDEPFVLYANIRLVTTESIEVIDTGRTRSLAHTFAVKGMANPKYLSAFWNTSVWWATGDRSGKRWTRSLQVEWMQKNPNAKRAAELAHSLNAAGDAPIRVPIGTVAALADIASYAEGMESVETFVRAIQGDVLDYQPARKLIVLYQQARNPRTRTKLERPDLYVTRVYVGWLNDEQLSKLYATRPSSIYRLPGWNDWMNSNWPNWA